MVFYEHWLQIIGIYRQFINVYHYYFLHICTYFCDETKNMVIQVELFENGLLNIYKCHRDLNYELERILFISKKCAINEMQMDEYNFSTF